MALFPYVCPLILLGYLISSRLPIIPNKLIRTCYKREWIWPLWNSNWISYL